MKKEMYEPTDIYIQKAGKINKETHAAQIKQEDPVTNPMSGMLNSTHCLCPVWKSAGQK